MKNSPSISQVGAAITHFIHRHHLTLFTLTVVVSVSVAVFLLNGLISVSNSPVSTTPTTASFDKATIDKINSFSSADSGSDTFSLPSGRINPFVE